MWFYVGDLSWSCFLLIRFSNFNDRHLRKHPVCIARGARGGDRWWSPCVWFPLTEEVVLAVRNATSMQRPTSTLCVILVILTAVGKRHCCIVMRSIQNLNTKVHHLSPNIRTYSLSLLAAQLLSTITNKKLDVCLPQKHYLIFRGGGIYSYVLLFIRHNLERERELLSE